MKTSGRARRSARADGQARYRYRVVGATDGRPQARWRFRLKGAATGPVRGGASCCRVPCKGAACHSARGYEEPPWDLVAIDDPQVGLVLFCLLDRRLPPPRQVPKGVGLEQRLVELAR
jgi:hypothetical protein